jgi:hypothetical protein
MRTTGFDITMTDNLDLIGRRVSLGVPESLAGCHTATIVDKIIEGHVPREDVIQFLSIPTQCLGLAVPGMPLM